MCKNMHRSKVINFYMFASKKNVSTYMYLNKSAQNFEQRSRRVPVTSYARDSISSGSLKLNSPRERYDSHRNPDDAE